jgi:hypothetical protein
MSVISENTVIKQDNVIGSQDDNIKGHVADTIDHQGNF